MGHSIIPYNIVSNLQFSQFAYDTRVDSDDRNPKDNILTSRLTFTKFCPDGIVVSTDRPLDIHIYEDLSGLASTVKITLEGFRSFVVDADPYPPILPSGNGSMLMEGDLDLDDIPDVDN